MWAHPPLAPWLGQVGYLHFNLLAFQSYHHRSEALQGSHRFTKTWASADKYVLCSLDSKYGGMDLKIPGVRLSYWIPCDDKKRIRTPVDSESRLVGSIFISYLMLHSCSKDKIKHTAIMQSIMLRWKISLLWVMKSTVITQRLYFGWQMTSGWLPRWVGEWGRPPGLETNIG